MLVTVPQSLDFKIAHHLSCHPAPPSHLMKPEVPGLRLCDVLVRSTSRHRLCLLTVLRGVLLNWSVQWGQNDLDYQDQCGPTNSGAFKKRSW